MGVTSSGLRWPEPAAAVTAGAVDIRNLAEDVTAKYAQVAGTGGVVGAGALSPDAQAIPAGAPVRVAAGKFAVTTDAAGQFVMTFPTFTTAVLSVTFISAVSAANPSDQTFSVAARNGNSVYAYVMRAGVRLVSTAVGLSYIAVGY